MSKTEIASTSKRPRTDGPFDTPLDSGYGMDINDYSPLAPGQQWDPATAYEAAARRKHDQDVANSLRETVAKRPSFGEKIVKIGDILKDYRRATVIEYISWLDEQAALATAEVEAAGGQIAAETHQASIAQLQPVVEPQEVQT